MRSVTTFFSLAAYASVEPGSLRAPNDVRAGLYHLPAALRLSLPATSMSQTLLFNFATIKKRKTGKTVENLHIKLQLEAAENTNQAFATHTHQNVF